MMCILLCGGLGTRLKPLTDTCPKPLLLVNGTPIIGYTIKHLIKQGFKKLVINIQSKDIALWEYAIATYRNSIEIFLLPESKPIGTAGTIKHCIENKLITDQDFLVIYGDVISFHDHKQTLVDHRQTRNWITALFHAKEMSSMIETNEDGIVTGFAERPLVKTNSGIYWFNKNMFYGDKWKNCFDIPRDILQTLSGFKGFRAFPHKGYRISIDTKERLDQAEKELKDIV
jgi:mannose-1-phosphate guanylyltransferase/phosphomannomutase